MLRGERRGSDQGGAAREGDGQREAAHMGLRAVLRHVAATSARRGPAAAAWCAFGEAARGAEALSLHPRECRLEAAPGLPAEDGVLRLKTGDAALQRRHLLLELTERCRPLGLGHGGGVEQEQKHRDTDCAQLTISGKHEPYSCNR